MFSERSGSNVADSSGNGHTLSASGVPGWIVGPKEEVGAMKFDGSSLSLATDRPVIQSDESFSVAAWVRLDTDTVGPDLALPEDWFAWTAIAQSGSYHSPFYLGVRFIEYGGEGTGDFHLHWNFTAAPIDGSDDGPVDWVHAYSSQELTPAELDQWVLLVGVYDLEAGAARIYVPTRGDEGETALPVKWPKWRADQGFQLGHAWFRDEFVDQWPGSIGPVWAYSGVLTRQDAESLRARGTLAGER